MASRVFYPATHRVRIDGGADILTEACFFGRGALRMFGAACTPTHPPHAGVLICPPIQSEFLTNYRREVLLARALAARGIAAARFHYRGTGHSDGDGRDVTFASMRRDAIEAADWMCERYGVEVLALLGTRLSALTAAAVAAERAHAPIAFWDPTLDGDGYFREVFRFRRMSTLSRGGATPRHDGPAEMKSNGFADVFGFTIERATFDSFRGRELETVLGPGPRSILLVQMDTRKDLTPERVRFVEARRRAGSLLDVELIQGREAWWFPGTQLQEPAQQRSREIVTSTCEWLTRRIPTAVPA